MTRVLVLGGTGEARTLAAALHDRPGFTVVSSLAGRVARPALPVGDVVVGGFGGVEGLAAFLTGREVDVVVDATHPFAATISAHAVAACAATGVPLHVLRRPGWTARDGDRWTRVPTVAAAAFAVRTLTARGATVLVTTGRRDLAPYAADPDRHYLVRAVDPPEEAALPPWHTVVLDRGPYTLAGELALLQRHAVAAVVTKDSGGPLTAAKLDAARALERPVVVVDRPPLPPGSPPPLPEVDAVLTVLAAGPAAPDGPSPAAG